MCTRVRVCRASVRVRMCICGGYLKDCSALEYVLWCACVRVCARLRACARVCVCTRARVCTHACVCACVSRRPPPEEGLLSSVVRMLVRACVRVSVCACVFARNGK